MTRRMAVNKNSLYQDAAVKLRGLLDGEADVIVKMASIASVLHTTFDYYYWTGFYRAMDGGLVIGPYQGTPGCLRIPFGRGVCGTAAASQETQVVIDVHEFPGHIACDARSQSEIVVPVLNSKGELLAVFDVDSTEVGSFDEIDATALKAIMDEHFARS